MKIIFYIEKRKRQVETNLISNKGKKRLIYYLQGIVIGILLTAIIGVEHDGNTTKINDVVSIEDALQQKILEMHKQGKSAVIIARELHLGIGTVKFVIDYAGKHKKNRSSII